MRGPCVWETCTENEEAGSQRASGVGAHLSTERQPDGNCVSELESAEPVTRTAACHTSLLLQTYFGVRRSAVWASHGALLGEGSLLNSSKSHLQLSSRELVCYPELESRVPSNENRIKRLRGLAFGKQADFPVSTCMLLSSESGKLKDQCSKQCLLCLPFGGHTTASFRSIYAV